MSGTNSYLYQTKKRFLVVFHKISTLIPECDFVVGVNYGEGEKVFFQKYSDKVFHIIQMTQVNEEEVLITPDEEKV